MYVVAYIIIVASHFAITSSDTIEVAESCITAEPHGEALLQVSKSSIKSQHDVVNKVNLGGAAKVHFKILGLYNTGTHFLRELILRNLGNLSSVALPNQCELGNFSIDSKTVVRCAASRCGFWKHSSLRLLRQHYSYLRLLSTGSENSLEECGLDNVIGLAMVRNPISWIDSVHRRPWDLRACVNRSGWINSSCTFPPITPDASLRGVTFSSIPEIWNNWTADYESLASFGFKRSLVITYEDLVTDTERVLTQIAVLANLSLPKSVNLVDDGVALLHTDLGTNDRRAAAANNFSKINDREHATTDIEKKSYLSKFSMQELGVMCARLNISSMQRFGYKDCDALATSDSSHGKVEAPKNSVSTCSVC